MTCCMRIQLSLGLVDHQEVCCGERCWCLICHVSVGDKPAKQVVHTYAPQVLLAGSVHLQSDWQLQSN